MNQFIPFSPLNVSSIILFGHIYKYADSFVQTFGGHKQSGLGVEGGIAGLKGFSNVQLITLNKGPALA